MLSSLKYREELEGFEMKQSIADLKQELFESFFEAHLAAENRSYFNNENKKMIQKWFNNGFENRNKLLSFFHATKNPNIQFAKYCWENGWHATKPERIDEIKNPLGFVLQFYGEVKPATTAIFERMRDLTEGVTVDLGVALLPENE